MGEVIQFPIRKARPGGVYCKPLGLFFPTLYKATAELTEYHIRELGVEDDEGVEPGTYVHFELEMSDNIAGSVEWEVVTHIRPQDQAESIIIRYHPSLERAHGYIDAHCDLTLGIEDEDHGRALYQTDEGIFTFVRTSTRASWPGPLVFYMADVPATNIAGWECWAHIVGPDGETLDPKPFGY